MKQRIFSFILLAAMLVSLTSQAQAQKNAPVATPQALISVALPNEQALVHFDATGLPVYTWLYRQDGRALLTGADALGQQALADARLTYRILDADMRGATYYLASLKPGQAALAWETFGTRLLDYGAEVLLRMDARSAEALALAGGNLRAVTLTPKPLYPNQTESIFPQVITPDPVIASILSQATQAMVYSDTADISGENPVDIGGVPYTILTRHTNSGESIQKATQFVGQEMAALGLDVEYHTWGGSTYPNVIGEIPGLLNPDDIYIIGAHLDDMPSSGRAPGADDNASGSVATLIAARLFSQYQWGCTLRFAFWTGEEQGLNGSAAYALRADNLNENILGYLNLDMIAWNTGGTSPDIDLLYNSSMPTTLALAQLFSDVVTAYDLNLIPQLVTSLGGGSDHSSFWDHGFTSILAIEDQSNFNPYYHTINDDLDNFQDWPYYTAFVQASLGTFAHMSNCLIADGIGQLDGTVSDGGTAAPIAGATVQIESPTGPTFEMTTDASGYYTQTLLTGAYTVTASAYGYQPVVTTTLIITDQVTTLDFSLQSAPAYTITGVVLEAGSALPLTAQVEVLDAPVPPAATDPFTGAYTFSLAAGSYTLRVSAPGHQPEERIVVVDQDQIQNFYLFGLSCILLVDDDNNAPDTRLYYTAALDNLGYEYTVFDTGGGSGNGPDLQTLQEYTIVLWFSGDKNGSDSAGPNPTDEINLTAYLEGGGRLFLDSQEYLYDMGITAFAQNYLGVGSFTEDGGNASVKYGVAGNPLGDGLGPFTLSYPAGFSDYADLVNPGAGASTAFRSAASGGGNSLDLTKASGSWKTVFFGTSWVPIYNNNNANGRVVLDRVLQWFGGCTACTPVSIDSLTSSSPVTLGETMHFTATVSGDEPLMYLWDFLSGGVPGLGAALADYTYALPGVYLVQLRALNICSVDTTAFSVNVAPLPIEIDLIAGEVTTQTLTILQAGETPLGWSLAEVPPVDWLSAAPTSGTAQPGESVVITLTIDSSGLPNGIHTTLLEVRDAAGTSELMQIPITLNITIPCAGVSEVGFTWLPAAPLMGTELVFTATATGTLPISYTWDFGDDSALASGITATHTFTAGGTYTITLTAINTCGMQVIQQAVTITPLKPLLQFYLPWVKK